LRKKSKNNIVWSGGNCSTQNLEELTKLREEINELNRKELLLDQELKEFQMELKKILETQSQTTFVTHDDIRELSGMEEQTIIAVRAQTGTRLEVPDPDYGGARRYQIFLKSEYPIDVYLVSQMDDEVREQEEAQKPSIYEPYNPSFPQHGYDSNPGLIRPEMEYYTQEGAGGITEFYVDDTL